MGYGDGNIKFKWEDYQRGLPNMSIEDLVQSYKRKVEELTEEHSTVTHYERMYAEQEIIKRLKSAEEMAEKKGTIIIKTSGGLVEDVLLLPKGYEYQVIECDKYGEPLPPETPLSCDDCTIKNPDPETDCGGCPVPLTGDDLGITPRG